MERITRFFPHWIYLIIFFSIPAFFAAIYGGILSQNYSAANYGGDGGDFLSAALSAGIPHPSGYPLYILLLRGFQWLPFSSPYLKGSLLSFLPFLISVGLISLFPLRMIKTNPQRVIGSILSGIIFGASPLVVSQAVIVEVYGLQTLLVVINLIWAWFSLQEQSKVLPSAFWFIFAFFCGLGLANHITSIFLVPIFFLGIFHLWKNKIPIRTIFTCVLFYFSGLLFYLYLPWLASSFPPVNWGNPQTFQGLFWLVSGQLYGNMVANVTLPVLLERIKSLAGLLVENCTVPGIFAGLLAAEGQGIKTWFSRSLIYFLSASGLFALFYSTNDSLVYLIPVFIIFSIWIGISVNLFWNKKYKQLHWGKIFILLLVLWAVFRIPMVREQVDPRQEKDAALFAENILRSAPPGAILLTSEDEDSFPLWYYHYGLNWRKDISLITLGLYHFDWYRQTLAHNSPSLILIPSGDSLYDQTWMKSLSLNNQNKPVCRSWVEAKTKVIFHYQCY